MYGTPIPTGVILIIVLFLFLVFVIVFLLLREFFTWYWKQNKIVSLLESIDEKLSKLTGETTEENKEKEVI